MEDITVKTNLKTVLEPGLGKIDGKLAPSDPQGPSFAKALSESMERVNTLQQEADLAIEKLSTGESNNVHSAMLAVGKADLAFRMTMQVRNKIVEAYQEVMRMQI